MTKEDRTLTRTFKNIREDQVKAKYDILKTISSLGKAFVNLQQMSAQQAVHIVLSIPLNCSSRKCVFVNTSPVDDRAFVLKRKKDLQKEADDSEDIMCPSIIDYYVLRPTAIELVCLAEFASSYTKKGQKHRKSSRPYVIRSVRYRKYKDIENHCREQLMLYYPYRVSETTIKQHHTSWKSAYLAFEEIVKQNEQKFKFVTTTTWGDIDDAMHRVET